MTAGTGSIGAAGRSPIELAFGYEPWTTANHLSSALASLAPGTSVIGPGHPSPSDGTTADRALLWVESGVPWLPSAARLRCSMSAAWLIDTHRGFRWRRRLAGAFDVVFAAQAQAADALRAAGHDAHWLPLAAPRELCTPGRSLAERPYDVAFVGQAPRGSLRAAMLDALDATCSLAPRRGYVPPDEMMQLYASARVVVNLPLADDLNMRVFEACGARSLLVTGPAVGLDHVLPDDSYVTVTQPSVEMWVRAVASALDDPHAQAKADAAHLRVLLAHTYHHRAATALATIEAATRRSVTDGDRTRALSSAFARWGAVRMAADPALPALSRMALAGEAAGWRAATTAKVLSRGLRRAGGAATPAPSPSRYR